MDIYSIPDNFILRTSLLSKDTYFTDFSEDLSSDDLYNRLKSRSAEEHIREAIQIASPNLYNCLDRFEEDIRNSLAKYMIRMSTRPTPYGIFSGVSLGRFEATSDFEIDDISNHVKRARVDMQWLYGIINDIEKNPATLKYLHVRFNSSSYKKGDRLINPYISNCGKLSMENNSLSASIRYSKNVELIMNLTKELISVEKVIQELRLIHSDIDESIILNFLVQLIDNEYLITNLRPPLVNSDPLEYLLQELAKSDIPITKELAKIQRLIDRYNRTRIGECQDIYRELIEKMSNFYRSDNYIQTDMRVATTKNKLSVDLKKDLLDAAKVSILLSQKTNSYPNHLKEYYQDFIGRYGVYREVLLLELLDDDMGLGTPATYSVPESNRYLRTQVRALNYDNLDSLIADKTMEVMSSKDSNEIVLSDEDIRYITENDDTKSYTHLLPDSFELNYYLVASSQDDIDKGDYSLYNGPNFGSSTMYKSYGRFSDMFLDIGNNAYNNFDNYCASDEAIVEIYETPKSGRSSNLTLNHNNCKYGIGMCCNIASGMKSISLDDITIGADPSTQTLYIKSHRLNKRLLVEMHSMINIVSGSNILRFLRELTMFRYINPFLVLEHINNIDSIYTPRIRYKKFILSMEKWILRRKDFLKSVKNYSAFKEYFTTLRDLFKIPQYVYLRSFDNRLLLNLDSELHLKLLYKSLKQSKTSIVITETEDVLNNNWLKDCQGRSYISEITVPYIKKKEHIEKRRAEKVLPTQSNISSNVTNHALTSSISLGINDGWLYIKLYGCLSKYDEIVGYHFDSLLKNLNSNRNVENYFFIRYTDPEFHIRLRIKLLNKDINSINTVIAWVDELKKKSIINGFVIDEYNRELIRYGGLEAIEAAEHFFYCDSVYVSAITRAREEKVLCLDERSIGILSVVSILNGFTKDLHAQIDLLSSIIDKTECRAFYKEHRKEYMNLYNTIDEQMIMLGDIIANRDNAIRDYAQVLRELDDKDMLTNSISDILFSIIHMFCNRFNGKSSWERSILALTRHTLYDIWQYNKHCKKEIG